MTGIEGDRLGKSKIGNRKSKILFPYSFFSTR